MVCVSAKDVFGRVRVYHRCGIDDTLEMYTYSVR